MKKAGIAVLGLLILLGVIFMWLLSQGGPSHANTDPVSVEVQDNFEK